MNQINLTCRFVTGQTVQIKGEIKTVADIKNILKEVIKCETQDFFIGFGQDILQDKDSLQDKGIIDKDIIHVITNQLTSKVILM